MKVRFLHLKWLRLSLFFLIISVFPPWNHIQAGENELNYKTFSQEITLMEAIHYISEQYQVLFNYDRKIVDDITVQYDPGKFSNVDEAISSILEETDLKYQIFNQRYVVLYKNDQEGIESLKEMIEHFQTIVDHRDAAVLERKMVQPAPMLRSATLQELLSGKDIAFNIQGTVTDQEGESLIGVNIQVKGSDKGTATDFEGKFSLDDIDENAVLVVSYIGYQTQEVPVTGKSTLTITMVSDSQLLDEVVVVGYGSQQKVNLTGAIATVEGKDLVAQSTPNLSNVLAGRIGGVTVQQVNGRPGASSSITVRGQKPLYVIDGIIKTKREFDVLNPEDIESISVLKDAAASAVYGARAAGGVILVITKIGNVGKPKISFQAATSIEERTFVPDWASAYEQALMWNDERGFRGIDPSNPAYYTQDELEEYQNNPEKYPNWLEEVWNNPVSQQFNLSISGGNENTRYFVSAAHYAATGFLDNITAKKNNLRLNLETYITKNLSAEVRFNLGLRKNSAPMWPNDNGAFDINNLVNGLSISTRTKRPYVNGYPTSQRGWHPIEATKQGYIDDNDNDFNGIVGLTYDIPQVKGLSVNARYSQHMGFLDGKTLLEFYTIYDFPYTGGNNHLIADGAEPIGSRQWVNRPYEFVSHTFDRVHDYQFDLKLNYENSFGRHKIDGLFVYEQFESRIENVNGRGEDLFTTEIPYLFSASTNPERRYINGSASESGRLSYIGRLSYNFDTRYLLETSFRYDGSVKFPKDQRWGFFPSVSAGWRISEEQWFIQSNFIDNLKLRGSIGVLGNDNIGSFQYLDQYELSGQVYYGSAFQGIETTGIPNYNITWQKSTIYNIGLDFNFLESFSFSGDFFYKRTTDILESRGAVVPGTFGGSLPDENWGEELDKGFELVLGYQNIVGDLNYSVTGNLGFSIDEVVKTFVPEEQPDFLNPIGYPRNRIRGYKTEGIIRTQDDLDEYLAMVATFRGTVPEVGWLAHADVRGPADENRPDGIVDGNDRVFLSDNAIPRINYGVNLRGGWKGLRMSVLIQGIAKWDRMLNGRDFMHINPNVSPATSLDYWTEDNIDAEYPRFDNSSNYYFDASEFWLRSAAFVRLKMLSLDYAFPQSVVSKLGADNLTFSFVGTNLLTLSEMKEFDPEQNGRWSYPMMKSYTFRLSVTF